MVLTARRGADDHLMVLQPTMQRITGFALISLVWVRCLLATSISGKEVGEALIMRKRDQFNRSLQESDSSARDDAFLTGPPLPSPSTVPHHL